MTYFSLRSCSLPTFQLAILHSKIARSRDSDLVLADGGLLLTVTETPIAIHAEYNQVADGSNTTCNRSETQGPKTPAFTTTRTELLLTKGDGEELSAVSMMSLAQRSKRYPVVGIIPHSFTPPFQDPSNSFYGGSSKSVRNLSTPSTPFAVFTDSIPSCGRSR